MSLSTRSQVEFDSPSLGIAAFSAVKRSRAPDKGPVRVSNSPAPGGVHGAV